MSQTRQEHRENLERARRHIRKWPLMLALFGLFLILQVVSGGRHGSQQVPGTNVVLSGGAIVLILVAVFVFAFFAFSHEKATLDTKIQQEDEIRRDQRRLAKAEAELAELKKGSGHSSPQ